MMKALEDVPELGLKGSSRLHKIPYGSLFHQGLWKTTNQLEYLNGIYVQII